MEDDSVHYRSTDLNVGRKSSIYLPRDYTVSSRLDEIGARRGSAVVQSTSVCTVGSSECSDRKTRPESGLATDFRALNGTLPPTNPRLQVRLWCVRRLSS